MKKKAAGGAQATLELPGRKIWPSSPVNGTVLGDAAGAATHRVEKQEMKTEEIIEHVVHGQLAMHNPRLRKVSEPLHFYVDENLHDLGGG